MRTVVEPLFLQYGVDLVLAGHTHAYERTFPVYNFTANACGPVHIAIGDGGNVEGVAAAVSGGDAAVPPGRTSRLSPLAAAGLPL